MVKKIIWTKAAATQLHECFINLLEQSKSIEITERVINEVYSSVEIYKLDNLKINNQGNIRFYQKHNFRISYLVASEEVYILRIRPSKKEPLDF